MSKKVIKDCQPCLFEEFPEAFPLPASSQLRHGPAPTGDRHSSADPDSLIAAYVEQVARDVATLQMDPVFWQPSREFYERRIEAYREAALVLKSLT